MSHTGTVSIWPTERREPIRGANRLCLDEVFNRLAEVDTQIDETDVEIRELHAKADALIVRGRTLSVSKEGLARLSRSLRMPVDYAARMRPTLRAAVQNSHLRHGELADAKMSDKVRILSRGSMFLGIDRADLARLSGQAVFEAVMEGLGDDRAALQPKHVAIRDESVGFDLVSERVDREVRKGDILLGGLHVEHSLIGDFATKVEPFLYRLVCGNGAVVRECAPSRRGRRTRRLTSADDASRNGQIEQIRRLSRDGYSHLRKQLDAVQELTTKPLKDRQHATKLFTEFLRQARMHSAGLMNRLHHAWEHPLGGNRELTYYGVLNALTWLATHGTESGSDENIDSITDRQASALLRLAGVFGNQSVHICPSCFRVIGG
jgi:hypothetical protein